MSVILFDVDGTLTPSREVINPAFSDEFLLFCKQHPVALVTGSDYEKTYEQVGACILDAVAYSFNCSGNAVYRKKQLIHSSDWSVSNSLCEYLNSQLEKSAYPGKKTGKHLENRIGSANFSIVGRNATYEQRKQYYEWDCKHQERAEIAATIRNKFPGIDSAVGGETGIDIFPMYHDKSQVLKWFDTDVVFFGDQCVPGGNDYALARTIQEQRRGTFFQVKGWMHTRDILRSLYGEHTHPINH